MRRHLSLVLRIGLCMAVGLAGAAIALAAKGPSEGSTALGTARVDLEPAAGPGVVDAYVPIVDWGIRSRSFAAPVRLDLEVRALDRASVIGALRSGADAEREVRQVADDVRAIVRREVRSALAWGLVGGAVGGLFGGALLAVFGRRRWLALGTAAGLGASAIVAASAALVLGGLDENAFREPVFYARGGELPELLAFSEQITETTERYTDSYEQALAGLDTLIAIGQAPPQPQLTVHSALVASDLHSNSLVLPALADYAAGKTVFAVGDFAQLGTEAEWWIVEPVAQLGARVVAVSGNHDSEPLMRRLAGEGVTVLTRSGQLLPDGTRDGRPVVEIDGLLVAGYDDPLTGDGDLGSHLLELRGGPMREEEQAFVAWFDSLPERPDVVLVHQHALAHALLDSLAPDDPRVLILTGHDHVQHLDQRGNHVLVDGGTVGAGGPFAIGQQPAGFAQLDFADNGVLAAVDLVEIEPLSGAGSAHRVPIAEPTGDAGAEPVAAAPPATVPR
jgi:predicted phosphodiesterase